MKKQKYNTPSTEFTLNIYTHNPPSPGVVHAFQENVGVLK